MTDTHGSAYTTPQEEFWAGEFGDRYATRNQGQNLLAANTAFFSRVCASMQPICSVLEFGANIGLNLLAMRRLFPELELAAIEINASAVAQLRREKDIRVYAQSLLEFEPDRVRDFVLIKGVLIHMNPECLPKVYDLLYRSTSRYLCIAEYYNPSPVTVTYRGESDRLFKRDFAGEIMDAHPDFVLRDYGFAYRRDPKFPQDDITWFLLEKGHKAKRTGE